jgi:hypothetical protein
MLAFFFDAMGGAACVGGAGAATGFGAGAAGGGLGLGEGAGGGAGDEEADGAEDALAVDACSFASRFMRI